MIQFIYGESGTGKTYSIMKRIEQDIENGIHAFLIVPEQQAVISEHMLLEMFPPSAQLCVEILSFSRLYNRICREFGGLQHRYITTPIKSVMMWKTLHDMAPILSYYGKSALEDKNLPDTMLAAIEELKMCCIPYNKMIRIINRLDKESPLAAKLQDLSTIYASFDGFVSESFSDSSDDMQRLNEVLREHNFFQNANVYLDSFTSFTASEHAVIARIMAQAQNVIISIPLEKPAHNRIFTLGILQSEKRLIRDAGKLGGFKTTILERNRRTSSAELKYFSKNIWNFTAKKFDKKDKNDIILESCANPYEESQAAARIIRRLLMLGYRCRDIMIITRNSDSYRGILDFALTENGVPFFFSEKADLCTKPLVKFLFSALRINTYNWRVSDVLTHLKAGMYDISNRDIDLFENYLTTWNIKGKQNYLQEWIMNPDGFSEEISPRGYEIMSAANRIRALLVHTLIPLFDALKQATTIKEMCFATFRFLESCGVKNRLSQLSAAEALSGNDKEAEEYASLYRIVLETLASIGEALPDEEIEISEWQTLLEITFSKTEIGTIPTAMDQVTIGSASMIRGDSPRCVIMLGLCESEFPAIPKDISLINTPERKLLAKLGMKMYSDADTKTSDEYLYVQKAISLPSERLILMTHRADVGGKEKNPSLPYQRCLALFPEKKPEIFNSTDYFELPPSLRAAKIHDGYNLDEPDTPIADVECQLKKSTVKSLFDKTMNLTQSRLERYIKCHFSYYCTYVLRLRKDQPARLREAELGTFVHYILEHLLRTVVGTDGVREDVTDDELQGMIHRIISEYVALICPENEKNSGKIRHLSARLKKLSWLLVHNMMEEFRHSRFRPVAYELNTNGKNGNPSPLIFLLQDGTEVCMTGIIDRVDMFQRDNTVFIRVVDYKTGTKEFSLDDIQVGLNIQMLLYLFTLCRQKNDRNEARVPGGVIYLSSNFPVLDLNDYENDESISQQLEEGISRKGLLLKDDEILHCMNDELSSRFLPGVRKLKDGKLTGNSLMTCLEFDELYEMISEVVTDMATLMKSGDANADPFTYKGNDPCKYCDMKPVCRNTDQCTVRGRGE